MRNRSELTKRYCVFLLGIWCNAIGVALITKSMLGTGPTTCIPYVVSLKFPLSFGMCTFLFNVLLLLLQILILRKKFQKSQFLQIPVSFLFAAFIDAAMALCSFIQAKHYITALLIVCLGCVFRAFGVSCQVVADVVMLSSEAFVKAVSDVINKEFSVMKLICDGLMTMIAVVLSFRFFGNLQAVREGTLITVLLVGPISHVFTKRLGFTSHYFENEGDLVYETQLKLVEGKRLVVTITSEAGSGGRVIAHILGEKLGLPVYDKELVELIAREGNFTPDYVRKHNERLYSNAVEAFFMENYALVSEDMESYRHLYDAQKRVIERLARENDCIIVGHCSNHILRNVEGCLHIHICADRQHRIAYMQDKYKVTIRRAIEMVERQDAEVSQYYHHFTGEDWKEAANYHLTMDSTLFGYEGTADLIEETVKKNYMDMPKVKIREVIRKYHLENG
ncbi:MAG: cytidylate kinase family protein [Lachnospiraceae bacterium]|nr:cytidylate kinase family protein [Lachnospiraceae bacterium]